VKIALVYIHPCANAMTYVPMARRFVESYMANPPGEYDHELHVCINGGIPMGQWNKNLFSPLAPKFFQHNNYGKDIGAYQVAADLIDCDLMVCLGAPLYFHRAGWLDRIVMAYLENGPAMYGAWGTHAPRPHLRTTAFWLPPHLLNSYPTRVGNGDRYPFEHGADSICLWSQRLGFEPIMVTWRGCYQMPHWHPIGRDESLFIDQHVDRTTP
jgi:hypothetical protein